MNSDIPLIQTGKKDERLEYVLAVCKQAVMVFVEALKKMEHGMRFKAIELSNIHENEISSISDLISTAIAIQLKEQAPDTIDKITYAFSTESLGDGKYNIWLTARNEKPDYSNVPKMEERPITDLRDLSNNPIVPPAFGQLDPEHHARC